ncbi:MAG: sugar-binding transcriptional regulator [Candidatus Nanopelagicales bacterium]
MAMLRDKALLVRAARLYYEQHKSQEQIAKELLTSRSNVSRMLSDARAQGIVEIRIIENALRDAKLEQRVLEMLPLRSVRITRVPQGSDETMAIGTLAAQALTENLKKDAKVAISWGRSLQAMVTLIEDDHRPDVKFIPLMGGMTEIPSGINGENLIRTLASKFNAEFSTLHAPAIVRTKEAREAFMAEPSIKEVLDEAQHADLAIVGIGARGSSSTNSLLRAAGIDPQTDTAFYANLAGDMASRFYDLNGNIVDKSIDERIIGVELSGLRNVKHVIGLAAGADKARGMLGAINGKHITELITTAKGALALLQLVEDQRLGR